MELQQPHPHRCRRCLRRPHAVIGARACCGATQLASATFPPRRCLPAAVAAGAPGHCGVAFAHAAAVSTSTDAAAAIAFALAAGAALALAAVGLAAALATAVAAAVATDTAAAAGAMH